MPAMNRTTPSARATAPVVFLRNMAAPADVTSSPPALVCAMPGTGRYPASAVQRTVEVDRRADQGQVRERLREVSQRLPRRADLLGVEPEVVGVGQHLLEDHA